MKAANSSMFVICLASICGVVGCGLSDGPSDRDAEAALSEISVVRGASGMGAKLAPDVVTHGRTFKALGHNLWTVTPNGNAVYTAIEMAEFRQMIRLTTPAPLGSARSLVAINVSFDNDRSAPTWTRQDGTTAGMKHMVDTNLAVPGDDYVLPSPYEGYIACPSRAAERISPCQARLQRADASYHVTIPSGELTDWKPYIDGFLTLMEASTAP